MLLSLSALTNFLLSIFFFPTNTKQNNTIFGMKEARQGDFALIWESHMPPGHASLVNDDVRSSASVHLCQSVWWCLSILFFSKGNYTVGEHFSQKCIFWDNSCSVVFSSSLLSVSYFLQRSTHSELKHNATPAAVLLWRRGCWRKLNTL